MSGHIVNNVKSLCIHMLASQDSHALEDGVDEIIILGAASAWLICRHCACIVQKPDVWPVAPQPPMAMEDAVPDTPEDDGQEPCQHMLYMSLYYDETPRKVVLDGVSHAFMECEVCDISVPLSKLLP